MKFTTELLAIDPLDGDLKKWAGPYIEAVSWKHAEYICQNTERGYLRVTGMLDSEVDFDTGEKTPHNLDSWN